MPNRSLIFTRTRRAMLDLPIRAFEGSDASHVGCRIDDQVIDSAFAQGGVLEHDYDAWIGRREVVAEVPVELVPGAAELADRWLRSQIGKPYDWSAIVGFLAWRDWNEPDSWYCSELAAAWCRAGGWSLASAYKRVGVRLSLEVAHARAEALGPV